MSWKDPNWKYRPSNATDLRKTFAAARKKLKEQAQKVTPLRKAS